MNSKRLIFVVGTLLLIIMLVFLVRWRDERDRRLVTLLGERIMREEYEAVQEPEPDEARDMRERLDADEWEAWTECVQWRPLRERIWNTLIERFQVEHDLMPTRAEIETYLETMYIPPPEMYIPGMPMVPVPEEGSSEWQSAFNELARWKLENTLYDAFGGRMAYASGRQRALPMDAYQRFFMNCEEKGLLEFHDKDFRRVFYACLMLDGEWRRVRYNISESEDTLNALREHPATRQMRIAASRMAVVMDSQEMTDLFDEIEWPAPWSSSP